MNYVANYYVKSNFLPIANCIGNRIGEGEDYTCDNSIVKNFLDTAAEEPYNLFQTVEQYKNDLKDLEKKNKKLENDIIDYKSEISQLQESNLFKKVEQYENEIKNLEKKNKKLEHELKDCRRVSSQLHEALDNLSTKKETFINIPKKGNGVVYVILFILAVFLFRKLKK